LGFLGHENPHTPLVRRIARPPGLKLAFVKTQIFGNSRPIPIELAGAVRQIRDFSRDPPSLRHASAALSYPD
jgi:hypothetical protein